MFYICSSALLIRRVLETILNAERGVASCGSDSHPLPREAREAATGHYNPGARTSLRPIRRKCG